MISPTQGAGKLPPDYEMRQIDIWDMVCPYTMTGPIRLYSLI
jgi:hypothetical protein